MKNGKAPSSSWTWPMLIPAAMLAFSVVGAFWAAVVSPLSTDIHSLQDNKLSIREQQQFAERVLQEINLNRDAIKETMSRAEQAGYARAIDTQFNEVNRQINVLQGLIGNSATIGGELERMQHDIEILRTETRGPQSVSVVPPSPMLTAPLAAPSR